MSPGAPEEGEEEEEEEDDAALRRVWAACPFHEGWMDEKGSVCSCCVRGSDDFLQVVTQVVCESLCANAEIQSIEGSMQEVVSR